MTVEEVETFGLSCRECKLTTAKDKATQMLQTYAGGGDFYDEAVIDALTDLLHYANAEGHDILNLLSTVKMHYLAEI